VEHVHLQTLCSYHRAFCSIYVKVPNNALSLLSSTSASRHMFRSPDHGDVRRRNICREILVDNKESAFVGTFYVHVHV
jgi:hypothetical protein